MKKSLAYRDSKCRVVYAVGEIHENKKSEVALCEPTSSSCEGWIQVVRLLHPLHPSKSLLYSAMLSRSQIFPNTLKQIFIWSFHSRG